MSGSIIVMQYPVSLQSDPSLSLSMCRLKDWKWEDL